MKEIEKIKKEIADVDSRFIQEAQERLDNLTKPKDSLGVLEELAKKVVGITQNKTPRLINKVIFTMAGDHGISEEGVSAFPKEVTAQMVYNFVKGGAGINVLARHAGARVVVVDMGVGEKLNIDSRKFKNFIDKKINFGTKNMSKEPAMSRKEAVQSVETGIEIFLSEFKNGLDIVGLGEMGIGNTTSASAITSVITRRSVEEVTGRGTGIDNNSFLKKRDLIKQAIAVNKPKAEDAMDVLSKVGGFEIGGLSGLILAAASKKIPVVIDGFITAAAALIAYQLEPKTRDYMIAGHCSVERGHKFVLEYIGLRPILDLNLRLGEGTGAVLAISLIEAGLKIFSEMASFESACVSKKIES